MEQDLSLNKLKWAAIASFIVALVGLILGGIFARDDVPPYPGRVVDPEGQLLFERADILKGQDVYQRYGLMDHGSIWGHGSQRGMEFSATTLHLMSEWVTQQIARREYGKPYAELDDLQKKMVAVHTIVEIKENRYDAASDTLTLTAAQARALENITGFWQGTFELGERRYGFLPGTIRSAEERLQISRFFFWTAWVASTLRPGKDYTYTNSWPADRSVGNVPAAGVYLWSLGGIVSLFVVLGIFIYMVHRFGIWYGAARGLELSEKMIDMPLTASQLRAAKYFLVVILLFLVQTSFGGLLAHYTVHPGSFFLPVVAKIIPYSWAKSWHLQLAIFWIATTWVASAIYLAPIIGGVEPRRQGLLVQILFAAILLVAAGSLAGEIAGIKGALGNLWFWVGHQGWEYLELGRLWQILLFVGLIAWLLVVYRAVGHHFTRSRGDFSALVVFYVLAAILVVAFFGFGLFYGRGSHLTVADYWRWFVVHVWVESIFELFGIAAISLLLVAMGLASARAALMVNYFTIAIVFFSGILGTSHHYFWYGGPAFWLGMGAVFSSLEPVPLFGLIVRGLMEYRSIRREGMEFPYKWPMLFLVASAFWNFLGAGVYGFLINLPIINYYEHGTYLTMNHGHAALFGVYGTLSIGLLLFAWRGLVRRERWNDRLLKLSFWGMNVGLMLLTLGTLLPIGVVQAWVSYRDGLWMARDASFFESGLVSTIGTLRFIPDLTIILLGVLPLAYFLFTTYPHLKAEGIAEGEPIWDRLGLKL
ncbi:MAG: cbb3-type cytochrome c oxidase subunit I [bacterium]